MNDEQKTTESKGSDMARRWHFWFLVAFSVFLFITFVLYLPMRFLYQLESDSHEHTQSTVHEHDDGTMHEHMEEMMESDEMMSQKTMHEHVEEMADHDHEDAADHAHEEAATDDHAGHGALYHEESAIKAGVAVNLNVSPVPFVVGKALNLSFFVNEKPSNTPIPSDLLEREHEKLMHVVGVRSDMNEFFHIHPEPTADNKAIFAIEHLFAKPGDYKIWSDVKVDGQIHIVGHPVITVAGEGKKSEKTISFSRNVIVGDYQVALKTDDIVVKNREASLSFDIHTRTGQEVVVEPYLGADMHLVIIKDDLKQFLHTHPEGGTHDHAVDFDIIPKAYAHTDSLPAGAVDDRTDEATADEVILFHAMFPEAGLYKAYAQFRPEGIDLAADEALTAEFWIEVKDKAPFPISQWWMLLVSSLVLMTALSLLVSRYLKIS